MEFYYLYNLCTGACTTYALLQIIRCILKIHENQTLIFLVNLVTLPTLTPVSPSTTTGKRSMIANTSLVSFDTPTWLLPMETIVTFLTSVSGAAISAAT